MSGRAAFLMLTLSLVGVPSLHAQDQDLRRQRPRLRERPPPVDRLEDEFLFPEDTLQEVAPDTLPAIDIAARRAALTEGDFPSRDSTFRVLTATPGFRAIEYRGRTVRLGVETQSIALSGDAQVNYASDVLTADTIRYLGRARFISARRGITLVGEDGKQVTSDSVLYYDVSSLKGTIFDARTEFAERGANWRVRGDAIPKASDTVFVAHGSFTSCDLEEPHYYFKAGQIKMVTQNVIVAWPVVLYVSNVPIFWLPFFAQDIRPGRHSGLLPPRFGFNDVVQTSASARRQVSDFGYYWAINDFLDAQATVDWFSGNYTRINGAFRYRFLKQFIRGNVLYSQSYGATGRSLEIGWNHDQELGLNTRVRGSLRFVDNTTLFVDRTFDPRLQTQTIDSDAGLTHRFSFADLSLSARRRQFLSTEDRTELTLPAVNFSFSPVTLFPAPRSRQGAFNNLTLSGSGNFTRRETSRESAADETSTVAGLSNSLRLRQLNISSSANFDDLATTPIDSLGTELPTTSRTTLRWRTSADYNIGLIGSTTLRPTVSVEGAQFKSPETMNDFVAAPTRADFGATLTTDIFGFFPGFGPFTRVRHKISPRFNWRYSPAVEVDSALAAIPGFPTRSGAARNRLSISLAQTFEAKVREAEEPPPSGAAGRGDEAKERRADSLAVGKPPLPGDSLEVEEEMRSEGGAARGRPAGLQGAGTARRGVRRERIVTLLSINSSPLEFDFERAKRGEPVLVTEQLTNSFTSDLLRGLSINMTHDLFEGSGTEREFKPFLSRLAASFSFQSGAGIGEIIGLGDGGRRARRSPRSERDQDLDSRYRLREFSSQYGNGPFPAGTGAGPWRLSLRYSLLRIRPGETGRASQTLDGTLSLRPTPHWSVRWTTQYNITDREFGSQLISLDRDLHRWHAAFQFARSPNGNVLFQVLVNLRDAPELKVDYNQRTEPPRR
ncbi:MAG: LPS-assembly protein LptD [Gemmatimonadota bacterium]